MRLDELRFAKSRQPFRPFTIRMADGNEVTIAHPDQLAWEGEHARSAVCVVPGGNWQIIDVALVTSVILQNQDASVGNP